MEVTKYWFITFIVCFCFSHLHSQVPTNGCQGILDGSCFRYYQLGAGGKTWSETKSKCMSFMSNLTTIRNRAEHDLVLSLIPGNRDLCWIGLNDIKNEGTFEWVDGSTSNFRLFDATQPNNSTAVGQDCVQTKFGSYDRWNDDDCDTNRNCFVCGAEIIQFGTIISASEFSGLINNEIIFTNEELFCVTESGAPEIEWTLRENSIDLTPEIQVASWNVATSVSTLSVSTMQQGYYRCRARQNRTDNIYFTVGVFNSTQTTVSTPGTSYNYTIGIDSEYIQILCNISKSSAVENIRWSRNGTFANPLNLFQHRNILLQAVNTTIDCIDISQGNLILSNARINIQGPPTITVSYPGIRNQVHSQIYPNMNSVSLPLPAQTLTLSTSLTNGRWRISEDRFLTDQILVLSDLNGQFNQTYQYYIINWEGVEVIAIQIHITTTGIAENCDAVYDGSCFTFYSSTSGLTWAESEMNCVTLNAHLASLESPIESDLLINIPDTTNRSCWIGLNDKDIEAGRDDSAFSWVDGSISTYRDFIIGQPTNDSVDEDFTYYQTDSSNPGWVNVASSMTVDCYYCKISTSLFGRMLPSNQSIILSDGILFTETVTLLCVNDNNTTTQWRYRQDSLSNSTDVTSSAVQISNSISRLTASIAAPGFYSCEVRKGGKRIVFSTGVFNLSGVTVALSTLNYNYIVGIDTVDANLFCNITRNTSIQNVVWRRNNGNATNLPNPLNIQNNHQELGTDRTLICSNMLDGRRLLATNLFVQGPPVVMLTTSVTTTTLSLLPPMENQLPLDVLTRNIILTSNILGGEWVLPDGAMRQTNTVRIGLLRIENNGVYSYYTEQNWENTRTLIMMINIEVQNHFVQRITSITIDQINSTAISIEWELAATPFILSGEVFRIYSTNEGFEQLLVTTTELSTTITNLTPNTLHTFIIELEYAFTAVKTRNTTEILLRNMVESATEGLLDLLIIVLPIVVGIILLAIIICCVFCCCIACKHKMKRTSAVDSIRLDNIADIPEQIHLNGHVITEPGFRHIYRDISHLDNNLIIKHVEYEPVNDPLREFASVGTHYETIDPQYETHEDSNTYQEIEEIVDSLMKPIPLDLYKVHLDRLWQNEGELQREYELLGGKEHRYTCENGFLDLNRSKNRFKQIYPYDKSRVILSQYDDDIPGSDYINASIIPGIYMPQKFIAAQAPKDTTLEDFWRMIIENKIVNIVMVTKLIELGKRKCEPYFPTSENNQLQIGQLNLILDSECLFNGHILRKINVTNGIRNLEIKHFHFTAWPDHDVPTQFNELLSFVRKVHKGLIKTKAPILVHCSAGVGRTGTFIALYNLTRAIQKGRAISIYKIVHEMREHRPQMVQTFRQYKFIYLAVLEMLIGQTTISAKDFTNTYKLYLKSDTEGYESAFFQQFNELNYQCQKSFENVCSIAEDPKNADKNHVKYSLPYDFNRVLLFSNHFDSDYINATCHDSSSFILSINPTVFCLQDFLQMVYQYQVSLVVMLTTNSEKKLIESGESEFMQYWPTSAGPIKCAPFILTLTKSQSWLSIDKKDITITHTLEKKSHTFTQFICTKWTAESEPTDLCAIVKLLKAINSHKSEHPNSTIILHCSDGVAKTGILYTIHKAIQESIERNEVDIFHIIKKLRSERMNSIPELNNYLSCYALMNEYYCDTAIL